MSASYELFKSYVEARMAALGVDGYDLEEIIELAPGEDPIERRLEVLRELGQLNPRAILGELNAMIRSIMEHADNMMKHIARVQLAARVQAQFDNDMRLLDKA